MHVFLSTTPIPAHTLNAAVFVAALVDSGHIVTWHAPRRFHPAIAALGARPIDVELAWDPDRDSGGMPVMGTLAQVRRGYARHLVGRAAGRAADVRRELRAQPYDVVLTDTLAYGAGLAAEAEGVPWATYGDGPLHDRDPDTPPFGAGLPYRAGWPYRLRNTVVHRGSDLVFAGSAQELARVRADLGLPAVAGERSVRRRPEGVDRSGAGVLAAGVSAQLHLHGGVPGLEYPRRRPLAAGVRFVGSLYRRPRGAHLPPWLPQARPGDPAQQPCDERPVVALTQGSLRLDIAELIAPTIAALGDEDCTILVAAGSPEGARAAAAIPTRRARVLTDSFVPYDALLERASLFVTNGGWTGVTEALARGVPVLQVGKTEEKADIGQRVQWSRCGLSIRRRVGPRDIAAAVARLRVAPELTEGLLGIRAQFAARDAGAGGVRLLRDLTDSAKS